MDGTPESPKSHAAVFTLILMSFIAGAASYFAYMYSQRHESRDDTIHITDGITPSASPKPLAVPSGALTGILTATQGAVLKYSRGDTEFKESTPGAEIFLGESIATESDARAHIEIPGIAKIIMEENAELVFANMYPENTVLLQKTGTVRYEISSGAHVVAIRALHALISSSDAVSDIRIIDGDSSVTVTSGSVKIALVDTNNDTHVWTIDEGKRATIDDASGTLSVGLPR